MNNVGVTGEVTTGGNGDRVNPLPVLPSDVVGRPLLNEFTGAGASEFRSRWSITRWPVDIGDNVVLEMRPCEVKRVDEKVWGVEDATLCIDGA